MDPFSQTAFVSEKFKALAKKYFACVELDVSNGAQRADIRKYQPGSPGCVKIIEKDGTVVGKYVPASREPSLLYVFLDAAARYFDYKSRIDAEKNDKDLAARIGLAEALIDLMRHEDAVGYLEKVIELDPEDAKKLHAKVYATLGRILVIKGEYEGAKTALDAATGMDEDGKLGVLPLAKYEYAVLLMKKEKHGEAVEKFTAFLTDYPDHEKTPMAMYQLGMCQFYAGDREKAAMTWMTFADKYPGHNLAGQASAYAKELQKQ